MHAHIRIRDLWIGLAIWTLLDIAAAAWRTAPHVVADLSKDASIALFIFGAWLWASRKVES